MWINKDGWREGLPRKEDMDEQRFSGIESDVKLLLAEMSGFIDSEKGKDARTRLKEVDGKIGEMEGIVSEMPNVQRLPYNRRIQSLKSERNKLASSISPKDDTAQRERLLRSTDRLNQSTTRLESSRRTALENEAIGAEVLDTLKKQRGQIEGTRETLDEADGSVNRSMKTLKDMGKWYSTFLREGINCRWR